MCFHSFKDHNLDLRENNCFIYVVQFYSFLKNGKSYNHFLDIAETWNYFLLKWVGVFVCILDFL